MSFIRFQSILHDSAVVFSAFWNFFILKRGDLIFWRESILQNSWIIWSTLLYFNFRNLKDPNSLSFIRFQWFLHDSALLFSVIWNFLKSKRGDLISRAEPSLQNDWIIWSPLLYFNYRNWRDPNSLSLIRFQCMLHDSAVLFSGLWNFLKLKREDLVSWGKSILQNSSIIWYPFCISILEIWRTQVRRYSLDFSPFYMIHHYFYQLFEISSNQRRVT